MALSERSRDMHAFREFVCFSKFRWEGERRDNKVFEVGCSRRTYINSPISTKPVSFIPLSLCVFYSLKRNRKAPWIVHVAVFGGLLPDGLISVLSYLVNSSCQKYEDRAHSLALVPNRRPTHPSSCAQTVPSSPPAATVNSTANRNKLTRSLCVLSLSPPPSPPRVLSLCTLFSLV